MNNSNIAKYFSNIENSTVPAYGYEMLRQVVLPDLLGKEAEAILYWIGKNIARKIQLDNLEDIPSFFQKMGWGTITLIKEEKKTMEFELTGELITYRFKNKAEYSFQLEAGFLAETVQQHKKCMTEAVEKQKRRSNKVIFTVQWEPSEKVELNN